MEFFSYFRKESKNGNKFLHVFSFCPVTFVSPYLLHGWNHKDNLTFNKQLYIVCFTHTKSWSEKQSVILNYIIIRLLIIIQDVICCHVSAVVVVVVVVLWRASRISNSSQQHFTQHTCAAVGVAPEKKYKNSQYVIKQ